MLRDVLQKNFSRQLNLQYSVLYQLVCPTCPSVSVIRVTVHSIPDLKNITVNLDFTLDSRILQNTSQVKAICPVTWKTLCPQFVELRTANTLNTVQKLYIHKWKFGLNINIRFFATKFGRKLTKMINRISIRQPTVRE